MTIPPIASEASASSCPDWMTEEWLQQMAGFGTGTARYPDLAIAREILRLRVELAAAKHWSQADELTLDRNRLLTENATLTAERDAEAREAAGYQKLAKEAADAEEPGLLVLIVDHDGAEVRIFGPDREAEERFGETVARWWKLVQVTGQCLDAEEKTKKAEAELAKVTAERDDARSQNSTHMANSLDWRNQRDAARADAEKLREAGMLLLREMEDMRRRHDILKGKHGHQKQRADAMQKAASERGAEGAELRAARAEVEQVRKILGAAGDEPTWMAAEKRVNMHQSAMRGCETLRAERRMAIDERDAAIRDRDEFAASEVERFSTSLGMRFTVGGDVVEQIGKDRAAELRKAAGAAAPVIIDEAPGATLPDVEPVVARAVEFSTPAADARQPLPLGRLEEMRSAYAAGAEKGTMTEPTKSRCRDAVRAIDELIDIRARLAASEKAKAELLDWCCQGGKNLCPTPGSADSFGDGIRRARQVIRGILAAAERAGGAS